MKALRMTEVELAEFLRRGQRLQRAVDDASTKHISDGMRAYHANKESKIERRLDQQIMGNGLAALMAAGPMARNYFFLPDRDFELDFAWPHMKIAVEVQGMAHRIKGKFQRDIEKRALALLAGWRVLEVDGASVRDGRAIEWLKQLLELRK